MIGCYVHHVGRGHVQRVTAIARRLDTPVTGLSSLPRPEGWPGEWVELPRDDHGVVGVDDDVTAGGGLHWAPRGHGGLRDRMATIGGWIAHVAPRAMLVDVSVEVGLLARLHGVPVVTTVLPGDRTDAPHRMLHALADRLVAAWPEQARGMVRGLDEDDPRLVRVGAISRFDDRPVRPVVVRERSVTLVLGTGGHGIDPRTLAEARASAPSWTWTVLDRTLGAWVDDPWDTLRASAVVVSHAGQNAVADVAAARRPLVVVPQQRPHDEQVTTARVLDAGPWPAVALDRFPSDGWQDVLDRSARLDGDRWSGWGDGRGADRAARVVEDVARRRGAAA